MNPDNNDVIQKFLDGQLSADEEEKLLQRASEDPELRKLLRLELAMLRNWSSETDRIPDSFMVPEGFSSEVMSSISAAETEKAESRLYRWFAGLVQPRTITIRPAWVTAAAAVLLAILVTLPVTFGPVWETTEEMPVREVAGQQEEELWMRFVYVSDDAEQVSVAGDFSDWETIPLRKNTVNGEVVWTGLVPLSRGEYRYMFVKDNDEWVTDPLADSYREDGFGNKNAVIKL